MTKVQFLKALERKADRGWHFALRTPCIRDATQNCPITAVYGKGAHLDAVVAGKALGLSPLTIARIMSAADGIDGPLRSRMLKMFGLKEFSSLPGDEAGHG